jgi:hypothetical protein
LRGLELFLKPPIRHAKNVGISGVNENNGFENGICDFTGIHAFSRTFHGFFTGMICFSIPFFLIGTELPLRPPIRLTKPVGIYGGNAQN